MSRRFRRLTVMVLLVALVVPAVALAARVTPRSRVSTDGLGPVKIGMTERQAERAGSLSLRERFRLRRCAYLKPTNRAIKAMFMTNRGRIVRTDVTRRGIRTTSGIRVGDSEASVRRKFAGRLRITDHAYVAGGKYLEFVPQDRADRNRRVIFETNGREVTMIRAGRLPEVRYVEGCA